MQKLFSPMVLLGRRFCQCFKNTSYSQTPSVLSAVRVQATCRVSMMTCTVSRSAFCRNTVMTTPISMSRLITIFLYSVISPCCPQQAIPAAEKGRKRHRNIHSLAVETSVKGFLILIIIIITFNIINTHMSISNLVITAVAAVPPAVLPDSCAQISAFLLFCLQC